MHVQVLTQSAVTGISGTTELASPLMLVRGETHIARVLCGGAEIARDAEQRALGGYRARSTRPLARLGHCVQVLSSGSHWRVEKASCAAPVVDSLAMPRETVPSWRGRPCKSGHPAPRAPAGRLCAVTGTGSVPPTTPRRAQDALPDGTGQVNSDYLGAPAQQSSRWRGALRCLAAG